ncbi:MAG: sugar/nucleoside kinase (ribokinase family) [Candidatus Paceibacteria bacterium]|jgi:sugar/nucleoside kinase (ribokinase family)
MSIKSFHSNLIQYLYMQKQIDFLAVGDIVTDAFIALNEESTWIEKDNPQKSKELCMAFGDKLPYDSVKVLAAVGNSPNASVGAHRLGLTSALVTNLGDDKFGIEQKETLEGQGVITDYVKVHEGKDSNYHYVLRLGAERTILVKHTEWDYEFPEIELGPKFLYLSSLAENSLPHHQDIVEYLKKHPETKLAFQPGTFQMKLGKDKLKEVYENTEVFFCNKEEAQRILETEETDFKELLKMMHSIGPKIVALTDGPDGSYAYDGETAWFIPMYPDPAPPVERTGAGDSFASAFTSALILGKTIPEALQWGPVNSMNVVQHIGAQEGLLTREEHQEWLEKRPDYFVAKEI